MKYLSETKVILMDTRVKKSHLNTHIYDIQWKIWVSKYFLKDFETFFFVQVTIFNPKYDLIFDIMIYKFWQYSPSHQNQNESEKK